MSIEWVPVVEITNLIRGAVVALCSSVRRAPGLGHCNDSLRHSSTLLSPPSRATYLVRAPTIQRSIIHFQSENSEKTQNNHKINTQYGHKLWIVAERIQHLSHCSALPCMVQAHPADRSQPSVGRKQPQHPQDPERTKPTESLRPDDGDPATNYSEGVHQVCRVTGPHDRSVANYE